jgi:hypothetical protein
MRFSVSDLLPFLDCEYKGATRWDHQHWTPPTRNMRLGTALHQYCDLVLRTGRGNHPLLTEPDIAEDLVPLIEAADRYLAPPPFRVLDSETPIVHPLGGGHELVGRLDGIACLPDIHSLQWKTVGKGVNIGNYLEKVRMSPHEIFYRTGLRRIGYDCRGTALGVFRTYLTKAQKEDNVPIYELFELPATEAEDEAAMQDILEAARRFISASASGGTTFRMRNWSACQSIFGKCPLFEHCHNGNDARELLPVPLESRYNDLPPYPPRNIGTTTGRVDCSTPPQ